MKKRTILLTAVSGILFMVVLITRPYEKNYNIDEEAGMKNIVAKVKELAENDSIYKIEISTQYEQRDMDYLTVYTDKPDKKIWTTISFNRSGAFANSVKREEKSSEGYVKAKHFNVSNLPRYLTLIEECKKLIPESYIYRHTDCIIVDKGRIYSIKIIVDPKDETKATKTKHVYSEKYRIDTYSSGRGGRGRTNTEIRKYYMMEFEFDEKGQISPM